MRKYLIIFGASGNLGKGVTASLIKKKYDSITLLDFDISSLIISQQNVNAKRIKDLSLEENVAEAFEIFTTDRNSEYFIFSTIGGYSGGKEISETSYDEWLAMQKLNANISFLIAKYSVKLLQKSFGGSILFTSAMTSINPEIGKAAYGASKSSLNYLVKSLALEGAKYNFTANAIAPLALDTEDNRKWAGDNILTKPEEIGEFISLLFKKYKKVNGNIYEIKGNILPNL